MEIRAMNRKSLSDFVNSPEFDRLDQLPISRHRALSQINNPRCSDSDIILIMATQDMNLMGYLGILPDYIYLHDEKIKAGWLSCFWVNESCRSQPVSGALLLHAMDSWERKILITNFVPSLAELYRRSGMFRPLVFKTGLRAYMRSNMATILPPKNKWFKRLRPAFTFADFLINSAASPRFLFFRGYHHDEVIVRDEEVLGESTARFISGQNSSSLTRRGRDELQWINEYPWIITQHKPDRNSNRYYFSSISPRFFYKMISFTDHSGNTSGFAMICVRDSQMTVPYVFSVSGYHYIVRVLINLMLEYHLSMITIFHEGLVASFKNFSIPFLFKKRINKPFLFSKKMEIKELNFNDGDGDCAFY